MTPSFQQLESAFQDSLEGFLWDQWVSIGLAGVARYGFVPFVIDPEALLLATTQFARHDSRFMEEVLDWVEWRGQLLSVQRIKNFHSNPGIGSAPVLTEIAEIVSHSRQKHWKTLLSLEEMKPKTKELPVYGKDIELRGMSVAPDPNDGESFLFRMRAIFGVNARAEVLTWLLTHDSGHPARIARETGWFSKSVQTILNDLESSGLVDAQRSDREKHFRLERGKWLHLLQPQENLQWFTQPPFYLACSYMLQTLRTLGRADDSSAGLQSILIRENITATQAALRLSGNGEWFSGFQRLSGEALIVRFVEAVKQISRVLNVERERLPVRALPPDSQDQSPL